MATDKWLTTIGMITQTVFWAIGYFFGFTLITMLSVGILIPGSFDEIGRPRQHAWHLLYRREGKFYLCAEVVAALGWFFLSALNLWWFLSYHG
jgi:hypothetical protein